MVPITHIGYLVSSSLPYSEDSNPIFSVTEYRTRRRERKKKKRERVVSETLSVDKEFLWGHRNTSPDVLLFDSEGRSSVRHP